MSLLPEQYLMPCLQTLAADIAPQLDGSYAEGSARTIALLTFFAMQDAAGRAPREAAETERLTEIFAAARAAGFVVEAGDLAAMRQQLTDLHAEAEESPAPAAAALSRLILEHFVATAEAAMLHLPPPEE